MNDVVIVTFSELSDARVASSALERLANEARITVHARALVVREADGRFRVPDREPAEALDVTDEDALGELLRTLVGPVGSLSRLASVALAGSPEAGPDAEAPERVLGSVARRVPPGTTALVVDMDAPTPRVLNTAIEASGGLLTRRLRADIEGELAATLKVLNPPRQMRPRAAACRSQARSHGL